jgi:hypothetical protein
MFSYISGLLCCAVVWWLLQRKLDTSLADLERMNGKLKEKLTAASNKVRMQMLNSLVSAPQRFTFVLQLRVLCAAGRRCAAGVDAAENLRHTLLQVGQLQHLLEHHCSIMTTTMSRSEGVRTIRQCGEGGD